MVTAGNTQIATQFHLLKAAVSLRSGDTKFHYVKVNSSAAHQYTFLGGNASTRLQSVAQSADGTGASVRHSLLESQY